MFTSAHASSCEQCSWWKDEKVAKGDLASEITWPLSRIKQNLLEA